MIFSLKLKYTYHSWSNQKVGKTTSWKSLIGKFSKPMRNLFHNRWAGMFQINYITLYYLILQNVFSLLQIKLQRISYTRTRLILVLKIRDKFHLRRKPIYFVVYHKDILSLQNMVIRPNQVEKNEDTKECCVCVSVCVVSRLQMSECVRATFWTRRWTRKCKDVCKNVFIIFLRWLYSCIRHEKYFKFVSRHKLLKLQFNSQVHSLYLFSPFLLFEWSPFSKKVFESSYFLNVQLLVKGKSWMFFIGMEFQCLVFCTWKKMEMKFKVICISKEEKFNCPSDISARLLYEIKFYTRILS